MAAYPARLSEIIDGISDGAEIQRAPKNPLKTASSGDDVNPSRRHNSRYISICYDISC
jgi:hypothetical protein